jgi:MoxR-like ATPase
VTPTQPLPDSISATQALLAQHDYIADNDLSTALYLSLHLQRPLMLEGEPGTGKTEIARTIAQALKRPLIRLQCHDGLDMAGAAYEWNYARQMMEIRLMEGGSQRDDAQRERLADSLFAKRFLIPRALLQAIDPAQPVPPVLLIDELDRADEAFEAYLLEVLSDFQITIPELGEIKAVYPPIVILTSNRTREIHDAVKRRCLYHWVDFPDAARELSILQRRVPGASEALSRQVVAFVQGLRSMDLFKQPGVAETLEWSRALLQLNALSLDPHTVDSSLGVLLKYQDDIAKVKGSEAAKLLAQVRSSMAAA